MPIAYHRFRVLFVTLGVLAGTAHAAAAPAAAAARPNILFIFSDDHAPHAIGAYGSRINATPNIDRLAREGMLFRRSFCTNSLCGPSRAVILTGKHNHLNGFRTNGDTFDGSQQTFPKLLQQAGYQTAMLGKWHLVSAPSGFDFWEVLYGQGPYYNPPIWTAEGRKETVGYTTEIITDTALEWLRSKRDPEKPFLLMFQHKAPHRNWEPGPKYLDLYDDIEIPEPPTLFDDWSNRTSACKTQTMTIAEHLTPNDLKLTEPRGLTPEQLALWNAAYGPKNAAFRSANLTGKDLVRWKYQRYIKDYLRCIAALDDNIGRVLAYLDESGLAKNTIVVYASDQGFYLGDHGWFDKRWMYEESLAMPLIVRWPGVAKPGSVDRHLVQNLDYAQTFLDAAGVEAPTDMQGRSLVPLLRGETPNDWRQSIYYHYYEFPGPHSVQRHYGARTLRHKLIRYYTIDEWELFDLEKDPDELRSVYDDPAYADIRRDLLAETRRLQTLYDDTEPEVSNSEATQRRLRRRARNVDPQQVFAAASPADAKATDFDPTAKPLLAGAWCTPNTPDGVVAAQGGESFGWSLYVEGGKPRFAVRNEGVLVTLAASTALAPGERIHLAGAITSRGRLEILVGARQVAEGPGLLISQKPADGLTIGDDRGSRVATYAGPSQFDGKLEDIRIYEGLVSPQTFAAWLRE